MAIPGVDHFTAFAFTATSDDPARFQSGKVDCPGSISRCYVRRVRTLLHEATNVMLTRCRGVLKLKD